MHAGNSGDDTGFVANERRKYIQAMTGVAVPVRAKGPNARGSVDSVLLETGGLGKFIPANDRVRVQHGSVQAPAANPACTAKLHDKERYR